MQTHNETIENHLNRYLPKRYTEEVIKLGMKDTPANRQKVREVRAGRRKDAKILEMLLKVANAQKKTEEKLINQIN